MHLARYSKSSHSIRSTESPRTSLKGTVGAKGSISSSKGSIRRLLQCFIGARDRTLGTQPLPHALQRLFALCHALRATLCHLRVQRGRYLLPCRCTVASTATVGATCCTTCCGGQRDG